MVDQRGTEGLQSALRDRYRIERQIGEGGMAIVYLATDLQHDRQVAVKVLRPEVAAALGHERFLTEIAVAAGLSSPHILPLYDSGEADGSPFYVMPLIEGESLRELLDREGQLGLDETLKLAVGTAAALSHAHSRGVIHRDIKPENILLADGVAVVADFGIALALTEAGGDRLTETGMVIGTPEYMSPEQAAGETRLDERTDIYALASVVYEMLTGEPPFRGLNAQAVLARRLTETPRSIRTVRDAVPIETEQVVMKGLARVPADRYRTAQQFISDLKHSFATGSFPITAASAIVPAPRRKLKVAAAIVVMAGLALAAANLWPGGSAVTGEVDDNLVAVLPFAVSGDGDNAYLSESVMSLLSAAFDGAGDMSTVDSRAIFSRIGSDGLADFEAEHRLAAGLGAGRWVSGRVVLLGGENVRLVASLYDGDLTASTASYDVEGPVDRLSSLAEQLAVKILSGEVNQTANPSEVRVRLSAIGDTRSSPLTDSLEALKEYLQGQADVRAGRYNAAIPKYQRAVAIDTGFAAAFHRLSQAAWSARRDDLTGPAAARAAALIGRLSSHDSLLVTGFAAYRQGRAEEATRIYRSIVQRFPTDVEAWYMLGETLYHLGPLNGNPSSDAVRPFTETLLLESGHRSAMGHLAGLAAELGDMTAADTLSAKYLRLHADADLAVWMEMLRAVALDDARARESVESQLTAGTSAPLDLMFAAAFYRDIDWAQQLATRATQPDRNVLERLGGHGFGAFILTAQGRMNAAGAELDAIEAVIPGLPLRVLLQANLAILPEMGYDSAALSGIEGELQALVGQSPSEERQILYLRAMIAVALGDTTTALGLASRLESLATDDPGRLNVEQARTVRARILADRGDPAEALRLLEENRYQVEEVMSFDDPTATLMHSRFLRAEILFRVGRLQEALAWFAATDDGVLPVNPAFEAVYLPLAHARRGEIYARMGENGLAADQFDRVLQMWSGADLRLQPMVERIRDQLQAVSSR